MSVKAEDWTREVFAKKLQKKQVLKGHTKDGKPIFESVVTDNILIQQLSSASVTVPVIKFVKMFKKAIESKKNKTGLQKATAIAADEKRGYAKFIEECKAEGTFK